MNASDDVGQGVLTPVINGLAQNSVSSTEQILISSHRFPQCRLRFVVVSTPGSNFKCQEANKRISSSSSRERTRIVNQLLIGYSMRWDMSLLDPGSDPDVTIICVLVVFENLRTKVQPAVVLAPVFSADLSAPTPSSSYSD
ncbi:hypothetical protein K435DRAFT_878487 [Dendrothele bispora CBS 962.96]|uniref:Uncharacterized protein n=1 Tax=Dendrothele bispora (strain CBS 962.96) TaxID=1314807 RepID=A0A4S8KMY6_DENBC|nr:hypothetical protein K435DRAFT_878487 [Dendrothele bispora CBS 962.96]